MIEDALRTRLLADSSISALIADRMYVLQAPQGGPTPYVVYMIVSENPNYTVGCVSDELIIQYSVFSATYAQARSIAKAIRANLENAHGTIGGVGVSSIRFDGIGANEREEDSRLVHISYDFRIILNNQ